MVEIRIATTEDAAAACDVLCRTIRECCTDDHRNDPSILAAWLGNKTPENVASWFLSPANCSLVAIRGKEVVGVAILTRSGKIVLLYVSPDVRFAGVGKALLRALEEQAKQWGVSSLQVNSTLTAQDFYVRNGFIAGKTTTSAFGTDAPVLSRQLPDEGYRKRKGCGCGG